MAPVLNPIDYDIPLTNRAITIHASSITCMLVALVGVGLRLWSRWKMVSALGWDDLFVTLAAMSTLFGCISLNKEVPNGLGLHERTIITKHPDGTPDYTTYENYFMWFYLTNAAYACTTTCIKLSLLFQYLRLFPKRHHATMHRTCVFLIGLVASWGLCFFTLIVFACTPIDKSWHMTKPGKCIMFGDFHPANAYAAYASQTASNMFLDTVILLAPVPTLTRIQSGKRQRLGLIGLFTAGTLVVITASLRLYLVVRSRAGTHPTVDPPWYAPPIILMSVLEVNLAILTASMPIFWPYLRTTFSSGSINVLREVIVRSEPRHTATKPLASRASSRADSVASDEVPMQSQSRHEYYADPAVAELVMGDLPKEAVDDAAAATGNVAGAWFEPQPQPPPLAVQVGVEEVELEAQEPRREAGKRDWRADSGV